ncbi:MAG: TlpA family protein disulfide reductase [Bacteroidales bacterium]|nr:TlpA family protein disulfide reductase [Bacteroidales bacterium]
MKKVFFYFGIMVFFASCVGKEATLNVNVEAIKEGFVELRYITPHEEKAEVIDTLYKNEFKDGKITIRLNDVKWQDGRKDCMLLITDKEHLKGAYLPVVLEKGRTVTIDIPVQTDQQVRYSGTKHAEDFNSFWNAIQKESLAMGRHKANLDACYGNMEKAFRAYIEQYPEAEISYIVLTYVVQSMRDETINPLLAYCNELCNESKSNNRWRNTFCEVLKNRELASITSTRLVFTAQDLNGSIYSERDVKGKFILVDFWASWCRPCKDEIPHLKELYAKYKEQGLEILSLSMDSKQHEWRSYMTNNPMPWLSLLGEGITLSERYNIEYIPFNLICDSEGNVLQKNLHGEDLDNAIRNLFEK